MKNTHSESVHILTVVLLAILVAIAAALIGFKLGRGRSVLGFSMPPKTEITAAPSTTKTSGVNYKNSDLNFSFTIPDGYAAVEALADCEGGCHSVIEIAKTEAAGSYLKTGVSISYLESNLSLDELVKSQNLSPLSQTSFQVAGVTGTKIEDAGFAAAIIAA